MIGGGKLVGKALKIHLIKVWKWIIGENGR